MSGGKFGNGNEELYRRLFLLSGRMAEAMREGDEEKTKKYDQMMDEVSDQIGYSHDPEKA